MNPLDLHPIMQVHYLDQSSLPIFKKAVVTIGSFDGVHLGHQQIIQQLKAEAAAIGGDSIIISFYPHPRSVISQKPDNIKLLGTLEEKTRLLEATGIDHLVIVPFDHAFASQTAEAYISDFLVAHFHPHTIIIGYDHKFGNNRKGDFQLLQSFGVQLGFVVKEIPEHLLAQVAVSSTKIRKAISQCQIETANQFLGYPYFFEGKVVVGNQLGRTIGYPTANLVLSDSEKLVPGNGVYAVHVLIKQEQHPQILQGMMNIGVRPTVDGINLVIEVNLFDFDGDLYGKTLEVQVLHFLRLEQKFNGLEALKTQLALDQVMAKQLLA
jgi:riboflavin kinase/FMN adenylyltransferase